MYSRVRDRGVTDAVVVPLGKKQIDRWTLKAILREANVTVEEFVRALR